MKPRSKKCRYCGDRFTPFNSFQKFCFKEDCIKAHNQTEKARKATKIKREYKSNDKSLQKEIAQKTFNTYIRMRDKDLPCISCGTTNPIQYHASHYIAVGKCKHLRFNLWNVHKSCSVCNSWKSGNLMEYRPRLIEKIGLDKVLHLEKVSNTKEPCKHSLEYYKRITRIFKKKIKNIAKP